MAKQWVLNANGQSFLTEDERSRFESELAAKPALKFRSAQGMITDDGEGHLWCGDRIVGTWQEPPPPPVQDVMHATAQSRPPGAELASLHAKIDDIRAQLGGITEALGNLHNLLIVRNPGYPTNTGS